MSFVPWYSRDEPAPPAAFQAGWEADRSPLFAARVKVDGVVTPGKVGPSTGRGCLYPYAGQERYTGKDYECFVSDGQGLAWKDASGATDMSLNPFEFGIDSNGQPLYLAQVERDGALCIGKCAPHIAEGAFYGYAGQEQVSQTYKVLCHA